VLFAIGEGFYGYMLFLGCFLLHYLIYLLLLRNLDIWFVPIPWRFHWSILHFARTWVLPSCAIFLSLCWVFFLLMISKFSSFKSKVKILGKDFSMMYYTIWVLHYYTLPMTINYFFLIMIFNNSLLFLSMSILT